MTPQLQHASALISLLHPEPSATALVEITSMPSKHRALKNYFFYANLAAEHAVEETLKGYGVYVGLNPRSQMSAFERDVPFVTTLGLDLQPERTPLEEVAKRLGIGGILPTATAWSGGGQHMYFKLFEPAEPSAAKLIWERLCKFTGSDPVFNVNRIFRIPGTLNWKSHPPRWAYLVDWHPERVYAIEEIDRALDRLGAAPGRPERAGIPVEEDLSADWDELQKRLPESVYYAIQTGERNPLSEKQVTRSEADWLVVCGLVRAGATDSMIAYVYANTPIGLLKYREAGARYLSRTIESARRATAAPIEHAPVGRSRDTHPRNTGSERDRYRGRRR